MSTADGSRRRAEPLVVGYWLSSEEHGPRALVDHAVAAEAAGFTHAMISDHFHPWLDTQGHAPFVWGVIGAIAQATTSLHVATGVSAPMRIHPAVMAQAAATAAVLLHGRFAIGVGTGERLNEHITGRPWPRPAVRRQIVGEAVEVMRRLFAGDDVSHEGRWHTTEQARLYSRPAAPPPIWVAASGSASAKLAGSIGDGMIAVEPSAPIIEAFEAAGGEGKPRAGQVHVCWAPTAEAARRTVHRWWPNGAISPRLNTELARPIDFEAACQFVDEATAVRRIVHGPDPVPYVKAVLEFAVAGFTHVYVHQIGPDQAGFFEFWERSVRPLFGDGRTGVARERVHDG
jgi:coenzyme F420-dependent glucose-6-phosphate dehydrogenase